MAGETATPTTRKTAEFTFTLGTRKYYITVNEVNYTGDVATALGYVKSTSATALKEYEKLTIGKALQIGIIFPIRIHGVKTGSSKQTGATVYVPRDKIEESFSTMIGKTFGKLTVSRVSPVLKRVVTA